MIAMRTSLLLVTALLLSGCIDATYEDISSDSDQQALVGQHVRTLQDLYLHLVTLDENYAERVGLCSITEPPGFTGPEVIERRVLPAGTTLQIMSVRRCSNCGAKARPELLVRAPGLASCSDVPLTLDRDLLGSAVNLVPADA